LTASPEDLWLDLIIGCNISLLASLVASPTFPLLLQLMLKTFFTTVYFLTSKWFSFQYDGSSRLLSTNLGYIC